MVYSYPMLISQFKVQISLGLVSDWELQGSTVGMSHTTARRGALKIQPKNSARSQA